MGHFRSGRHDCFPAVPDDPIGYRHPAAFAFRLLTALRYSPQAGAGRLIYHAGEAESALHEPQDSPRIKWGLEKLNSGGRSRTADLGIMRPSL